jgi:hypothetical protein
VRVDLADRSPERLAVVTMRPARARVTVAGTRTVGELRVDGEAVAQLPWTSFTMCPGHRTVEAVRPACRLGRHRRGWASRT